MAYIGRGLDNGVRNQFVYAATQGQTAFTGADSDGKTLAMTDILYTDCYQNGVKLEPTTDYTLTSTTLTLVSGASLNDVINIVSFDIFAVADTVAASTGGTFVGQVTFIADTTFADGADIITATAGTSNFRAGVNAGNSIESGGNYNTVVGDEAGTAITTGDNNVAVGYASLDANNTGSSNTAVGSAALGANTTGNINTAVGLSALATNTEGLNNSALGVNALNANTTGDDNVAIGYQALLLNTTADDNTAVGKAAGGAITTGGSNTFVGSLAGDALDDSHNNVAVGVSALSANCGSDNVAIGKSAGASITGEHNTIMGYFAAGQLTSGSRNLCLGHESGSALFSNGLFQLTNHNDRIVLGTTEATHAYIQIDWTVVSDERDKTEIEDMDEGLSLVNQMRPISYKFKTSREDDTPKGRKKYGFSAQDVLALEGSDAVIVDDEEDEKLKITNAHITPVLVNAIKELSAKNDALEARLAALEAK